MPAETGNQIQVAFIQEAIFKTTPATPTGQILRKVSFTLADSDAATLNNPELRRDRQKAPGRRGARRAKGDLSGVLSYGTYDAFLAAALGCHAWTANVVKIKAPISTGAISLAVAATAKTFTRSAGSFVTDGFAVGDVIQVAGCSNSANNGTFVVSNVAALVLTCSTASGLVDETSAAGRVIATNVRPSFTFERQHLINGFYFPFRGTVVTSFEISGKANANVDVKFGLTSASVGDEARSTLFSTLTAAGDEEISTTWTGTVKKDGTTLTALTGWSLKADPGMSEASVCGSEDLYDITPGTVAVTGSLEMIFDSYELYTAYRNETAVTFQTNVTTEDGTYTFDVSNARITKFGAPSTEDGLTKVTVDYEGYNDATNTALKITRTAA
jgi:hypothetical protein